jgi:hypothetical protein
VDHTLDTKISTSIGAQASNRSARAHIHKRMLHAHGIPHVHHSSLTHSHTHTHTPQADFLPNPHIPIASTDKLVFHTQKLLHLCVDPGASLMEALHTHSTRGYLPKSMLMHSTRARTHTHPHNPYTILYPYFNPRLFLNPDIRLCTQHNMHFQTPNQPESDPSCTPT